MKLVRPGKTISGLAVCEIFLVPEVLFPLSSSDLIEEPGNESTPATWPVCPKFSCKTVCFLLHVALHVVRLSKAGFVWEYSYNIT